MKSHIVENKIKPLPTYPCLKISEQGRLVLFTEPSIGFCLHDPEGDHDVFEKSQAWAEKDCFRPFSGSVTLTTD